MRTEEDVLKDFKKFKWKICENNDYFIRLASSTSSKNVFCDRYIKIYKKDKSYRATEINMQEHKLLNELFNLWGGFDDINNTYYVKGITIQHKFKLTDLVDQDFEILPRPKRVGDLKCCEECGYCEKCPIIAICNGKWETTLYQILEYWKESDNFDQEIYDLLKARLDKEVVEE